MTEAKTLEPIQAVIALVVLFSITAVAAYFGVPVRPTDGALLVVIWILVDIIRSGKRVEDKVDVVHEQVNSKMTAVLEKLDKVTAERDESLQRERDAAHEQAFVERVSKKTEAETPAQGSTINAETIEVTGEQVHVKEKEKP